MTNLYEEYKDDPKMLVAIADGEGKYRNAGRYFLYK